MNLTPPLADALWKLGLTDEPQSRRALAERLHCDPSNVTFLVDRLVARGLASTCVDPDDRRFKMLRLTATGKRARQRFARALVNALESYGLDRQDQQLLAGLLRQPPFAVRCRGSPTLAW